uniref:Uncharacterized protein n=1 Tax=Panagrolaimus sp. PS1159 TaxID=55785 RepID=A0AC35FS50_9BILA
MKSEGGAAVDCQLIGVWGNWEAWTSCPVNPPIPLLNIRRRLRDCIPQPAGCTEVAMYNCNGPYSEVVNCVSGVSTTAASNLPSSTSTTTTVLPSTTTTTTLLPTTTSTTTTTALPTTTTTTSLPTTTSTTTTTTTPIPTTTSTTSQPTTETE